MVGHIAPDLYVFRPWIKEEMKKRLIIGAVIVSLLAGCTVSPIPQAYRPTA